MLRTKSEAEQIARARHGDLAPQLLLIATSHYQRVQDWACTNCANIGTIIKLVGGVRSADCMCKIIRKKKLIADKLRDQSNMPHRYHDADIRKWVNVGRNSKELALNNASYHAVEQYANNLTKMMKKGYGLYLTGPNGVGKTYLACGIANKSISSGYSVKYYTMSVIVQTEIKGWRDQEAASLMAGIKKSQLLIIDDIDKVYRTTTGIETALFDNLLRERLQANRPCIFTSNRTITDASNDYNQHIASMLIEHCAELVFVGQDHRRNMSDTIRREILNGGD